LAGKLIVLGPEVALAAWIADRSETCPEASWPVVRITATVSFVVVTENVAGARRPSSSSKHGRDLFAARLAMPFRFKRKLNIEHVLSGENAIRMLALDSNAPTAPKSPVTFFSRARFFSTCLGDRQPGRAGRAAPDAHPGLH
jgi:hypothetical protein